MKHYTRSDINRAKTVKLYLIGYNWVFIGSFMGSFMGTLSIYDAPTDRNTSIIEVCTEQQVCTRLLIDNSQLDTPEVANWILEHAN